MSKCALTNRKCPKTNDQNAKFFCPAWHDGIVWTNSQTNEEKIVNCSFEMMIPAMIEVIQASNRPAAAIESTRNEISKQLQEGFTYIGDAMNNVNLLAYNEEKDIE